MQRRHANAIYYEREDDGYAWKILPITTTRSTFKKVMRWGGMSKYGIIVGIACYLKKAVYEILYPGDKRRDDPKSD